MTDEMRQRIAGCRQIGWKLALESWQRLPTALQIWVDPEDLYQEAVCELCVRADRWDGSKSRFTTFAYMVMTNALHRFTERWMAQKRGGGLPVHRDLEDLELPDPATVGGVPVVLDGVLIEWLSGSGDAN